MNQIARSWRVAVASLAVGACGALGIVGLASPIASADPVFPPRPNPVPMPAPAPQAVAMMPGALGNAMPVPAPQAAPAMAPAAAAAVPAPAPPAAVPPAPPGPPAPPELAPAAAGTLREFFTSKGVKMEPQKAPGFNALDLVLPMPNGWTQVPDPNVPDAFVVTANRRSNSFYKSNAQLVVYRLVGDFDPHEAITHGYIDSQQQPAWRTTNASLADFNGAPSSIIEGTYRQDQMTVNTSRRHVIVTSGPDKYLVSLAVTTDASQAVAEAPSTDGIVNGFRAGPPGSTPPAAPAAAPAPPAPAAPPAVAAPPQALAH